MYMWYPQLVTQLMRKLEIISHNIMLTQLLLVHLSTLNGNKFYIHSFQIASLITVVLKPY